MNPEQKLRTVLNLLPADRVITLTAPPGSGKLMTVRKIAEEMEEKVVDLRLSQCVPGDIRGLPMLSDGVEVFVKPVWWPRDPDSKGVLYFDELDHLLTRQYSWEREEMLRSIFAISFERCLDGEKLPNGWRVIWSFNASLDLLDLAILDRIWCIYMGDDNPCQPL